MKIKQISIISLGLGVSQAINLFSIPLITKLYSPDDFGIYAFVLAMTLIFASVVTGRYELAVVLDRKRTEIIGQLCLITSLIFSICFAIFAAALDHYQEIKIDEKLKVPILISCVIFLLLISRFNFQTQKSLSEHFHDRIAYANIGKNLILVSTQLFGGYLKLGVLGLLLGQLFGIFSGIKIFENKNRRKTKFNILKIKAIAKKHKKFVLYSMPATLVNGINSNTVILVTYFYNESGTLGLVAIAQRIISVPLGIMGTSIGQIYYRDAVESVNNDRQILPLLKKNLKILAFTLGIAVFFVYIVIADMVYYFMPPEWKGATEFMRILLPISVSQFIISAISPTYNVIGRQKLSLVWQTFILVISIIYFGIIEKFKLNFVDALEIYAYAIISITFFYCLQILISVSEHDRRGALSH